MYRLSFALLSASAILMSIESPTILADTKPGQFTCVRAVPTAIVKKSVFPNSYFVLKQTQSGDFKIPIGIETIKLPSGDKLTIENSGCEYFTLSFKFETARNGKSLSNRRYWSNRLIKLMQQIEPGTESPISIEQGIAALETDISQHPKLNIGKEIDYGGSEIRSIVAIDRIEQISTSKVALVARFSYGPM
jgi:hypothetical protein